MVRGCTRAFLLSSLLVGLGCRRKPAAELVVNVAENGRASVGDTELSTEELGKLLRDKAQAAPRDADGLPILSVTISAHPECEYRHVQDVVMQCWRRYIWQIAWEMDGKRLDASLPRDNGSHIIYEEYVAHPPLSFTEPPSAAYGVARQAELARLTAQATHQLRIMLCWLNEKGQVIHSPSEPFPDDWPSVREPVSTVGAHVTIWIKTVEVCSPEDVKANTAQLSGLDALTCTLVDFVARDPEVYAVIDARRAVPVRWVFDTLDACKRANVWSIFFEQLRMQVEHGDDWFWM